MAYHQNLNPEPIGFQGSYPNPSPQVNYQGQILSGGDQFVGFQREYPDNNNNNNFGGNYQDPSVPVAYPHPNAQHHYQEPNFPVGYQDPGLRPNEQASGFQNQPQTFDAQPSGVDPNGYITNPDAAALQRYSETIYPAEFGNPIRDTQDLIDRLMRLQEIHGDDPFIFRRVTCLIATAVCVICTGSPGDVLDITIQSPCLVSGQVFDPTTGQGLDEWFPCACEITKAEFTTPLDDPVWKYLINVAWQRRLHPEIAELESAFPPYAFSHRMSSQLALEQQSQAWDAKYWPPLPDIKPYLKRAEGVSHGLIGSFRDRDLIHRAILATKNVHGVVAHDDVPTTNAELRVLAHRLFVAFKNNEGIDEEKTVARVDRATDLEVEKLSWDFLEVILQAERGECQLPPYGIRDKMEWQSYGSFTERFEDFESIIATTKTICKNLLDASWLSRLTWNVGMEKDKKASNKVLNDFRALVKVAAGEGVPMTAKYSINADGDVATEDGKLSARIPRKFIQLLRDQYRKQRSEDLEHAKGDPVKLAMLRAAASIAPLSDDEDEDGDGDGDAGSDDEEDAVPRPSSRKGARRRGGRKHQKGGRGGLKSTRGGGVSKRRASTKTGTPKARSKSRRGTETRSSSRLQGGDDDDYQMGEDQ